MEHAVALTEPGGVERDPMLLWGLGALVLFAFHAEVDLECDPDKGWRYHLKTTGL